MSVMLAIETSQHEGSVALLAMDGRVHEEPLHAESRHEDDLLPAVDRLCIRCHITPSDLRAVGVSIGPGGFTGLRIAVTTAKMFAETLGAQLVAVPSALVAAETFDNTGAIGIALASKRERFWWTRLQRTTSDSTWQIDGAPAQADAATLDLQGLSAVLADRHRPRSLDEACKQAGIAIHDPQFNASACLAVASRMLSAGLTTDPLELAPLYSRQPEAVSLWQRRSDSSSR